MNESVNMQNPQKPKHSLGIFDIAIYVFVIVNVSLYDVKILFLGMQAIVFALTILYIIANQNQTKGILICYFIWLVIFSFFGFLSALWARPENVTAIRVSISVVQVGLIAFCILYYCVITQNIRRVLYAFVTAALVFCARFFLTVPISAWGQAERFEKYGIFGSNNPAMVMAYASIILIWMCFFAKEKIRRKGLALSLVGMFMFISILMGTKKSLLIFIICLLIFLFGSAKDPLKFVGRIVIVAVAFVVGYLLIMEVPMLYNSIGYRIQNVVGFLSGGESDLSTIDRANHVTTAFGYFRQHPIAGLGQDGYRYTNARITYSHNNYVELLANLGIVGFCMYYWLHVVILKESIKIFRFNMLPVCFIVAILISDIAVISYASEIGYALQGIIVALLCFEKNKLNFNKTPPSMGD